MHQQLNYQLLVSHQSLIAPEMLLSSTMQCCHLRSNAAVCAAFYTTIRHLSTGESIELSRQFGQQHVDAFVQLTGDSNPIHSAAAADQQQCSPAAAVVPGMLLVSMFPAIIGSNFPGALYLSQTLKFRRSAAVDTRVTATVTVAKRSGSRVAFDTVCRDDQGRVLVDGTALALITDTATDGDSAKDPG